MKMMLSAMLSLAILPVPAIPQEDDIPDEEIKARIVTHFEMPDQCLSAVVILEIDDEETTVNNREFELEPGPHTMNGRAAINTGICPVLDGEPGRPVPDLEAEFEAGKTYYVGLDHSSSDRGEWHLVIWQVDENGSSYDPRIELPALLDDGG
jgi:hypothetical protein